MLQTLTMLDAVTSFTVALLNSLRAGIVHKRSISLEFPRHAFNFLFNNKGTHVRRKPGRLYYRQDFPSTYFNDHCFSFYNNHGEGCFVTFPVYMYSYVKYSQLHYAYDGTPLPRAFMEILFVKLVKTRDNN